MYNWERSVREDKMRKNPKNPSFSSTLLDEIYREMDGGEELKQPKEKNVKKHSNNGGGPGSRAKARTSIEDEEMESFRRACLIEKWMEKKVNEKFSARRGSLLPEFDHKVMQDNDPLFFSSSSSSSDSSFGGFSSSETESLGAGKSRTSFFTVPAPRPNPVRTSVQSGKFEHSAVCQEQSEFYLFDDYRRNNHQTNKTVGLIKSKTRALKIYDNLKKVKQPISPGGRITSFINSLFTNGNPKKNKDLRPNGNGVYNVDRKNQTSSACSSASSLSRFYLSKNSPNSKEKLNNVNKRTEDSRRCDHKSIYDEDFERFGMPNMLPLTNGHQPILPLMNRNIQKKNDFVAGNIRDENYDDEDYEEDAASDSSSDLFELDHLALFKNDKFCNDLPVYGTTNLGMNRAIASGLIR